MRCDAGCCEGAEYVDEVGLMVVEDAIRTYARELRAKAEERDAAFAEAERITEQMKGGG